MGALSLNQPTGLEHGPLARLRRTRRYLGPFCLAVAGLTQLLPTSRAGATTAAERVSRVVAQATEHGFAGCVLVRDSNGVVFEKAIGTVDRDGKLPAKIDTAFGVASVSKQFTAVAILQLEGTGRLALGDSITRFFADVPEDKRVITLHQLLSHTSGMGQNNAADGIRDRNEAVRAILAVPLEKKVGEGFGYSNDGYNLLAAVVEIASGVPFERYMHEHIFAPAGMTKTFVWGEVADLRGPDYAELLRELPRENDGANWGFRGATGVHTTVEDVDRYWTALSGDKLISRGNRERMLTPHAQTRIGPYGYGWFVNEADSAERRWMTRGNEDFGPNGIVIVHPDRSLLIVVLSHRFLAAGAQAQVSDIPWSRQLGEELEQALTKAKP